MEKEAWRRGVDGVPEPLVSAVRLICDPAGEPIMIPRYRDSLLAMLLRAHRPDKYKDRSEVQFDISDRLAERLEAARQRLVAKEQPAILDLKADESAIDRELELVEALVAFRHDPLGFVRFAYPWGEPGTEQAGSTGPRQWQADLLDEVGRRLREGHQTGRLSPIQIARASGHGVGKSTRAAAAARAGLARH